ncbi:cupin domain-containing protein [Rhodocaloribacter sp.]
MEIVSLVSRRRFRPEKMQKIPVFESPRLFFDQYCLLPGQFQKVHAHAGEDKIYVVLEGTAVFDIGGEQRALGSGHAVIARAGVPHGVRNDGDAPVTLLVTMAPRPDRGG